MYVSLTCAVMGLASSDAERMSSPGHTVHDMARDKMYLDIRQTFSIWFFPMYNAHVRLVTVLDLVATDDADYHEPLDKLIEAVSSEKQDGGTSSTTVHLGTTYVPSSGRASRRWKISKQEDLYQVNQFFRFTGPTPLSWLWFLFQLGASAVCVFLALFVRLSPWSMQKEPAKGGVEAVIELRHEDEGEKVEHTEHTEHKEHKEHMEYVEHTELGDSSMGRAGSISEESSLGGDGSGSGAPTNGHRRLSANSKASPSQLPKKSRKNGKKR